MNSYKNRPRPRRQEAAAAIAPIPYKALQSAQHDRELLNQISVLFVKACTVIGTELDDDGEFHPVDLDVALQYAAENHQLFSPDDLDKAIAFVRRCANSLARTQRAARQHKTQWAIGDSVANAIREASQRLES